MIKRILFNLVLLSAVFYTPWWIVIPLAFVGAFTWSPYYEIIGFGVLVDILYGADALTFGGGLGIFVSVIIYLTALYAKKALR